MIAWFDDNGDFSARAYVMDQDAHSRDLTTYLAPIDTIEAATTLDFFPDMEETVETVLDADMHDEFWRERTRTFATSLS